MVTVYCSDVRLNPIPQEEVVISSSGSLCLTPPDGRERYNKILFVMDKSGSNTQTDPHDLRASSMREFVDKYRDEPYHKWGYVAFGVDLNDAHAYINYDGDMYMPRFGDDKDMDTAIDTHMAVPDEGCTPYFRALDLAKKAIELDMEKHPEQDSIYNILFISDGFPNDRTSGVISGCGDNRTIADNANDPYIRRVREIVGLAPDRVYFNTAYYTPSSQDQGRQAARGLSHMAKHGGGKFVDLQDGARFDFDSLLVGPRPESWMMKRMVVANLNSAFCSDGTVGVDSDADGICDKDELLYNEKFAHRLPQGKKFDPQNRNSLDPHYSDLFSYRFQVLPTGGGLNPCRNFRPDEDFDLLNSCEEAMLFDSHANGPTPQWTERMRQSGGTAHPLNPDSSGDGFIDSLKFFQFGVRSAAVNYKSIFDRYSGGITAETLMTERRHPMRPEVFNDSSYDLRVRYQGVNVNGENCYSFGLTQLALYNTLPVTLEQVSGLPQLVNKAGENTVLIYYISVPERDPNGLGYYHHSFQKFHYEGGWNLRLDRFDVYKVPEEL